LTREKKATHLTEAEQEEQKRFTAEVRHHPGRPGTYFIVTYGCQMNAHDSEKIAGMLEDMGMEAAENREQADFVIFNTCCIRDNAERKALGNVTWLKEIKKSRPEMMIAVCGCMVQEPGMAEKLLKQYRFVDLAFGTSNLHRLPELILKRLDSRDNLVEVDERDRIPEGLPIRRLRKEFAYLTIMYGCDNFCSYCIVPYVRGRERSRNAGDILKEAEQLARDGVQEIMLLGQNVNSYGKGTEDGIRFPELLKKLDDTGIPRIRFMTSHPKDLSDELIEVMAAGKHILPQFHLPVQSGNNDILRQMNRHYTREQYLDRVRKLREAIPGIGLSTDLIVAFPGETDSQFRDTLDLVKEVRYDSAFMFVYSPRVGTKAAEMPNQVDPDTAAFRIQELIRVQEDLQKETLKRFVSMEEEVLAESLSKRDDHAVSGKGRHAVSVTLPGTAEDVGKIIRCRITAVKNNTLMGERI
jgi:tRNA-2-methylthio-N6-dimethylallyladenosine synthase